MTDLAAPVRPAATPMARLEPIVFAHARIPMLTTTTAGVVVEANAIAAEVLGLTRSELVQEPLDRYVTSLSGRAVVDCLGEAAVSPDALSFGPCAIRRRGAGDVVMELVVSSGCRASGRDLLLAQLVPLR